MVRMKGDARLTLALTAFLMIYPSCVRAAEPGSSPRMTMASAEVGISSASMRENAHVQADFNVSIGGVDMADGSFAATVDPASNYSVQTSMKVTGVLGALVEVDYQAVAQGAFEGAKTRPTRFFSDVEGFEPRKINIAYDEQGKPVTSIEPPFEKDEIFPVSMSDLRATADPLSALIIPAVAGESPCMRTVSVFDGRRRFDLKMTDGGMVDFTAEKGGFSGPVVRCRGQFIPVAGYDPAKLAELRQHGKDVIVLMALADNGRIYVPMRVQFRAELGAFIAEVTRFEEYPAIAQRN